MGGVELDDVMRRANCFASQRNDDGKTKSSNQILCVPNHHAMLSMRTTVPLARRSRLSWGAFLCLCSTLTALQVWKTLQFVGKQQSLQRPQQQPVAPKNLAAWRMQTYRHYDRSELARTDDEYHRLRFDWTNLERKSPLAQRFAEHQSNCTIARLDNFRFRNRFGLGSDLHVYSQALCNALEDSSYRVRTVLPWIWRDGESCSRSSIADDNDAAATASAMTCYFPESELACPDDQTLVLEHGDVLQNMTRGRGRIRNECPGLSAEYGISNIRAAATEFLFTRLSKNIQREAERQLQAVFRGHPVPKTLITVHVRWGDKADEMELLPIHDYIEAVERILEERDPQALSAADDGVHIYLATEDPRAVLEFRDAAEPEWNIYVDHYFDEMLPHRRDSYNGSPLMAQQLNGRPGFVAIGSLLVAMEANYFVLTTASNWSRLINELRLNVLNPRCQNCTHMIDLKGGEW